jgi:hypothetical protein
MIICGIDEAGYGPLLGPLVVGSCAFEIEEDEAAPSPPCLWKRLRRCVSKNRSKTGRTIHVNDSKQVYSANQGLKELERSVLALAAASGDWCDRLETFLGQVAPAAIDEAAQYDWYAPAAAEPFPIEQQAMPIKLFAKALRDEMGRTKTRCLHLRAELVFERRFNEMVHATRNKASASFSIVAMHLDRLLTAYGARDLFIVCDRQGGRAHYGSLLRLMFPAWSLEIDSETEGVSEYTLRQEPQIVRLCFREKAEASCLPVAVASMLSKYLREAMMRRFNAFWQLHLPGVTPTAGYHGDGTRFLTDIDAKRRELGILDDHLVRAR